MKWQNYQNNEWYCFKGYVIIVLIVRYLSHIIHLFIQTQGTENKETSNFILYVAMASMF